ncbi:unnamed protein product [Rotaria magnacalcarata]|uniref:Uncharacterized protein n=1 Tax=Rotaria magnacalcarata TaxID=392030 RepID=A0A816U7L9_9BILA|nr:unnamed protein product [Rotaria magnacalcarata]
MLRWFEDNSKNSKNSVSGRGNQVYTLAIAPIYDEWVRNNYELQNIVRDAVDRIEKYILEYIHHCTQHVKKVAETRIQLAKSQMAEFKALEDFEQIATSSQWNIHVLLKPKMKLQSTKK